MHRYVHVQLYMYVHARVRSCTSTVMQRYAQSQVLSCACMFMHRYVHAQVPSFTCTFMHRYVHSQVLSCSVADPHSQGSASFCRIWIRTEAHGSVSRSGSDLWCNLLIFLTINLLNTLTFLICIYFCFFYFLDQENFSKTAGRHKKWLIDRLWQSEKNPINQKKFDFLTSWEKVMRIRNTALLDRYVHADVHSSPRTFMQIYIHPHVLSCTGLFIHWNSYLHVIHVEVHSCRCIHTIVDTKYAENAVQNILSMCRTPSKTY